jgi:uncharacterized protein (TIGR00255 family)
MIKSMTGFGKAETSFGNYNLTVQLKSLNSKQLDFSLRAPSVFRERELELRSMIVAAAVRGKVELTINMTSSSETGSVEVNQALFKKYHNDIKTLMEELGENTPIVPVIAKFPDVLKAKEEEIGEAEWEVVKECIRTALKTFDAYRTQEGEALYNDIESRVKGILELLQQVAQFEGERVEQIRNRIAKNQTAFLSKEKVNEDRFEQEMIYYLEKLDITEEKTRLLAHCNYFLETMQQAVSEGKKMGFIAQEMGREINTIGSKANHAGMQKVVVQMKDELEKIKEQLLNVL